MIKCLIYNNLIEGHSLNRVSIAVMKFALDPIASISYCGSAEIGQERAFGSDAAIVNLT